MHAMVSGGAFQLNTIQLAKFAYCLRTLGGLSAVTTGIPLATTHMKMLFIMNGSTAAVQMAQSSKLKEAKSVSET